MAWYRHTVWSVVATIQQGNLPVALALLISARQEEPEGAPDYEAVLVRKKLFEITLESRPVFEQLAERIDDLRRFAANHEFPAGELSYLNGLLQFARGDWTAALASSEDAYRDYADLGSIRSGKALMAALCCLRLGLFPACQDWIASMAGYDQEWAENAIWQAELSIRLALASNGQISDITRSLRVLMDRSTGSQDVEVANEVRGLTMRVNLLDQNNGDPAAPHHPSRQELKRRLAPAFSVANRYGAHLLLLDYRLACLRFVAGVSPVDDLYYNQDQEIPVSVPAVDAAEFASRLRKARKTAQWTLRYAQKLDTMLECDWREKELLTRIERIEQIANGCGI
jgi:hypothetical protein